MRLHKKSTPLGGLHQYHPNYSYTANSHPQPNYKPNYPRQHYDFALDSKLNPGGPLF
jgi:hypothetical protein